MDEFNEGWFLYHSYRWWIAVGLRRPSARPGFLFQPRCRESLRPPVQGLPAVMDKRKFRVFLSDLKIERLNLWIPLEKWEQRWGVCVPHRAAELLGLWSRRNMERTKVALAANTQFIPSLKPARWRVAFEFKKCCLCLLSDVITNYIPAPWKINTFTLERSCHQDVKFASIKM